jgi:hypothetical protein
MKRTKVELKLRRQLKLVRSTVRELTPEELKRVNGGGDTFGCASCPDPWTGD